MLLCGFRLSTFSTQDGNFRHPESDESHFVGRTQKHLLLDTSCVSRQVVFCYTDKGFVDPLLSVALDFFL